jgi:N-acyl-L-homoserine lactone synthetase
MAIQSSEPITTDFLLGGTTSSRVGGDAGTFARQINLSEPNEVTAFQELRYDYFVRQRGWVTPDPDLPLREADAYDAFAHHLAVFKGDLVVAYVRVLPGNSPCGFMLEREFHSLLPATGPTIEMSKHSIELSRLVVAPPPILPISEMRAVTELLFKLLYWMSLHLDWQDYYIVVEQDWISVFNRRFHLPFQPLGQPFIFPDGTRTVAAHARVADLESALACSAPHKLAWYRSPD